MSRCDIFEAKCCFLVQKTFFLFWNFMPRKVNIFKRSKLNEMFQNYQNKNVLIHTIQIFLDYRFVKNFEIFFDSLSQFRTGKMFDILKIFAEWETISLPVLKQWAY